MATIMAADGLPVRDAGAWTKHKLYYVKRYANAFMNAMAAKRRQGKWDQLAYIDLLCGPGRCRIRDSGEVIDGSPLLAVGVAPSFDRFYFADTNRRNVEALRKRIPADRLGSIDLRTGDCNMLVRDVVRHLPARTLAIAFLDPEGFEVHYETLRTLASRPIDILYLFPSGIGLKRNVAQFVRGKGDLMDLFWGGAEWRHLRMARLAAAADPLPNTALDIAETWVGAFRDKVRQELHLQCGQTPPLITNDRNARMYHLLFFSKNEAGLQIWRNICGIDPAGQRFLPY